MKPYPPKHILTLSVPIWLLLSAFICTFSSCKTMEVESRLRDREIVIDGKNSEWNDILVPLDENGAVVGLMNDDQFLYFSFLTTNRGLYGRIMRQGLTLWFDKDGGENKVFGIHFPLRNEMQDKIQKERTYGRDAADNFRNESSEERFDELELCGPGEGETHRMTIAEATGIEAKISPEPDKFFYEIRVPLYDNGRFPFAIGIKPPVRIGIGIEVINHVKPADKTLTGMNDNESYPNQGMNQQSGEYGRNRGTRGEGSQNTLHSGSQSDAYKTWLKVQLKVK